MLKLLPPAIVTQVLNQSQYHIAVQYEMNCVNSNTGFEMIQLMLNGSIKDMTLSAHKLGVAIVHDSIVMRSEGKVFVFVQFTNDNHDATEMSEWLQTFNKRNYLVNKDAWMNNQK